MGEKNVRNVCISVTHEEMQAVDDLRRENYTLNQSEVFRMLIDAGIEKLLGRQVQKVV